MAVSDIVSPRRSLPSFKIQNMKSWPKTAILFIVLLVLCTGVYSKSSKTTGKSSGKASGKTAAKTQGPVEWVDSMSHDIFVLNDKTFQNKVHTFRNSQISSVFFFRKDATAKMPHSFIDDTKGTMDITVKEYLTGTYNNMAKDLKGMINVCSVDCDEYAKLCKDNNIPEDATARILVFPLSPFPSYVYPGELAKDSPSKLAMALTSQITSTHVNNVNKENVDTFVTANAALPKVLLFSERPKAPILFLSLANSFASKMEFGFVDMTKEDNSAVASKYNVKKYPTLLLLKFDPKQNKHIPVFYKGKDFKFRAIHDEFLNVHAETFVKGGGFSDENMKPTEAKPWLNQRIPELTKASHVDICFAKSNKSKGLCVIYLKDGSALSNEETVMLEELATQFTPHLADRGTVFRWMWMDVRAEVNFRALFEADDGLPSVVVFNPYKRLRFTKLASDQKANFDHIKNLLDKITGGDARFKNVPGQVLPEFAVREEAAAKKSDEL